MSETGDGLDHLRIPYDKIKFGNKLETQGYGTVFEGDFEHQRVALKQLNITNLANIKSKLLAEIKTIYLFRQHPNLVALIGFCDEKSNEIILVYEYVSSGNLEDKMRKRLNTIQRFEICLGAARGLCYLHTGVDSISIVHGNIKLSKILLNSDANSSTRFVAKVSSFGLSKIVPGKGHKVLETSDEEAEKRMTKESDVYSFGVLLLIVLCGVSELVDTDDYQERHVSEIVPKKMKQDKLRKTVHLDIRKEIKTEALETYAKIACQCVMENPEDRPDMVKVVEELERALILQGGEVTYVEIPSRNIPGAADETVGGLKEDGVSLESNIILKKLEPDNLNISPIIEDDAKEGSTVGDKVRDAGEVNCGNEITLADKNLISSSEGSTIDTERDKNHIEDAKNENINNDLAAEHETLNDLDSEEESIIMLENEDEDKSNIIVNKGMSTTDPETEGVDDFDPDKKSTIIEENKEDDKSIEITTTLESSNGDTSYPTNQLVQESVNTHLEDAKNENSNDDPAIEKETLNDLNSIQDSTVTVENEENRYKSAIKEADNDISTTDQVTTKEIIDDLDSNKESKIIKECKEDDESTKITTTLGSSKGDTSTSTCQEVEESNILQLDRGSFREVDADELQRMRIPLEKIKFGEKIDVRGYGTMFKGEYIDQQVALKRLNVTNLHNIKPKLLSAILTISRFQQHPNLVALIGYCDENNKEIVLVYEYVSGGNLEDKMSKHLTTIQRLQICLGAARGVEYLHSGDKSVDSNPYIIHGNIKLSKILLNSNSNSSNIEAKVSGFGLPKLLPGHVEIVPKSMDPVYAVTGKLSKESDVYSFGVLLLEVLCGVPELVDTDDYQERHVTELVPKRLEQNMLRKIVHSDIRDEITTESLETYAIIACRCVMKNPEERPTMPEVVVELEKALRLQGGKVSDVHLFGNGNVNGLAEVVVGEDDQEGNDNRETMSSNITKEESMVIDEINNDINLLGESFLDPALGSNIVESVPKDAETKNDNLNDPKSTEETIVDEKPIEESKISLENEVTNENMFTPSSESENGEDGNSAMGEKVSNGQLLSSSNGNGLLEVPIGEDDKEGNDNGEMLSSNIVEEESKVVEEPTDEIAQEDAENEDGKRLNEPKSIEQIKDNLKSNEESKINGDNELNNEIKTSTSSSNSALQEQLRDEISAPKENVHDSIMSSHSPHVMEVQNSVTPDDNGKAGLPTTEETKLTINDRGGDLSNFATQIQEYESKRSNSTSSESSNGDDTTPSDHLLPKSPDNVKKTSRDSSSCFYCFCSCSLCSWWRFISDRVVMYGGLFWNKLVSCFTWMTGQCARKRD